MNAFAALLSKDQEVFRRMSARLARRASSTGSNRFRDRGPSRSGGADRSTRMSSRRFSAPFEQQQRPITLRTPRPARCPHRRVDGSHAVGVIVAVPSWRMGVFPFGRPVVACEPVATGPLRLRLGCASEWAPCQVASAARGRPGRPSIGRRQRPEPFWTGADEVRRVGQWMTQEMSESPWV